MPKLKDFQDERKRLIDRNAEILKTAEAREDSLLTAEEKTEFDANIARQKDLADHLERNAQQQAAAADIEKPAIRLVQPEQPSAPNVPDMTPSPRLPACALRWTPSMLRARGFHGEDPNRDAVRAGMSLAAQIHNKPWAHAYCRRNGIVIDTPDLEIGAISGLNEGVNTAGGVLVAPEVENTIISLRQQFGVMRQMARVKQMSSEVANQPRKTAGMTAYHVQEGTAGTESQSSWDNVQLVAKTVQANTRISVELSEDSIINLAADIAQDCAVEFSYIEDQDGFNGDGSSTYGGIFGLANKVNDGTHAASIFTTATGHTAFTTLTLDDFEGAYATLPRYPGIQPAWYFSQFGYWTSAGRLKYAAGGNATGNLAAGTPEQFLGLPVVITQVLNATAGAQTNTIVGFVGDMRMTVVFGDRRGITIQSNPYEYMSQRQISVYATERFDINVCNLGDSSATRTFSTVGPMVAIKMAGS